MDWKRVLRSYDYLLAVAVIALGIFGVVMIYSSAWAEAVPLHIAYPMRGMWRRQAAFVGSGAVLMIGFSMIDYHWITKFFVYGYGLMMLMLVSVLFFGVGDGPTRSLPIPGTGISVLPSEFAKILMTIFLAKFIATFHERINKPVWLALLLVLIIVPVFLVFEQPSFSASMVVLSISLVVLFVGGLYWRTIAVGAAVAAPIGVMIWFDLQRAAPIFLTRIFSEFQWRRIESLLRPEYAHPDDIRQTLGSLYAIGTGGLTGRGFLQNPYVILGHNDFIFSVAASQFGFVGAVLLLAAVAFVVVKCVMIALKSPDLEGRLIAAGVAGMLIVETFFHVGVATDLLPNTGMPFPFLSYGGSMIWVHMIAMGIVLNIGLPRKPKSMFEEEIE